MEYSTIELVRDFFEKYPGYKKIPNFNNLFSQLLTLGQKMIYLTDNLLNEQNISKKVKISQKITRVLEELNIVTSKMEELITYADKLSPDNVIKKESFLYTLSPRGFLEKYPAYNNIEGFKSLFSEFVTLYNNSNNLLNTLNKEHNLSRKAKISQKLTILLEKMEKLGSKMEPIIAHVEKQSPDNLIEQGSILFPLTSRGSVSN